VRSKLVLVVLVQRKETGDVTVALYLFRDDTVLGFGKEGIGRLEGCGSLGIRARVEVLPALIFGYVQDELNIVKLSSPGSPDN
jgi:hypothetical protein